MWREFRQIRSMPGTILDQAIFRISASIANHYVCAYLRCDFACVKLLRGSLQVRVRSLQAVFLMSSSMLAWSCRSHCHLCGAQSLARFTFHARLLHIIVSRGLRSATLHARNASTWTCLSEAYGCWGVVCHECVACLVTATATNAFANPAGFEAFRTLLTI